jgi:hypothetical protein
MKIMFDRRVWMIDRMSKLSGQQIGGVRKDPALLSAINSMSGSLREISAALYSMGFVSRKGTAISPERIRRYKRG